jgi:hypothetical protein
MKMNLILCYFSRVLEALLFIDTYVFARKSMRHETRPAFRVLK